MRQKAIREPIVGQIVTQCRACIGNAFMDIGMHHPFIKKGIIYVSAEQRS